MSVRKKLPTALCPRRSVASILTNHPRHVQVAEMVIEKAKRLVEHKKDVVILLILLPV